MGEGQPVPPSCSGLCVGRGTLPRARRQLMAVRTGMGTVRLCHGKWIFSLGLQFPFGTSGRGGRGLLILKTRDV